MNIFYLDKNPVLAAQYHYDTHVVKMCLETAQLLCTAQHQYITKSKAKELDLYRATHVRHPCAIWVSQNSLAYVWTYELFEALLAEYKHRYGKTHASSYLCDALREPPSQMIRSEAERNIIYDVKSARRNGENITVNVFQKKFKLPQPP